MNSFQPVIIIGAGRSGTKYLRNILSANEEVCSIPYDVNYIWRLGSEEVNHDELNHMLLSDSNVERIRYLLIKTSRLDVNKHRFFLEKTVSNCLRIDLVDRVFPNAKYINLVRDGRAVVESSLREWQAKPDLKYLLMKLRYFPLSNYQYAFNFVWDLLRNNDKGTRKKVWGPAYSGIVDDLGEDVELIRICARQWRRCIERAQYDLSKIDKCRVKTVKYEELVESVDVVKELCEFIGLPNEDTVVDEYLEKTIKTNVCKWKSSLDNNQINFLNEELKSNLIQLGYQVRGSVG